MPRNNEQVPYESLLEFQEVYLRAVALAWTDEEFKTRFLAKPRRAMADYFGYSCPWNVALKVSEPDTSKHKGWDPVRKTWDLPRIKLSFGLPKAPQLKEQLIAFAAYNDSGPTYLFTCC